MCVEIKKKKILYTCIIKSTTSKFIFINIGKKKKMYKNLGIYNQREHDKQYLRVYYLLYI